MILHIKQDFLQQQLYSLIRISSFLVKCTDWHMYVTHCVHMYSYCILCIFINKYNSDCSLIWNTGICCSTLVVLVEKIINQVQTYPQTSFNIQHQCQINLLPHGDFT